MRNKSYIAAITLFALALINCSKEKRFHTTVKGKVIEKHEGQAITDATVFLLEKEDDGGIGSISSGYSYGSSIKTTTSGSDGSYAFDFTARKGYIYFVTTEKVECEKDGDASYVKVNAKKDNEGKNIPLITRGYVKLHIKNIDPYDEWDNFSFTNTYLGSTAPGVNHDYVPNLKGMSVDSIIKIALIGNFNNSFHYYVSKNSIQTDSIAYIYCPAFDTTNFEINY